MSGGERWVVYIDRNPFIIGRTDDSNLFLLSRTVSRNHAEIYRRADGLFIRDLRSKNGTYINGKIINRDIKLNNGDNILFGDVKFKIYSKTLNEKKVDSGTYFLGSPKKPNEFFSHYYLTKREEEILFLVFQGKSAKEIAKILFVSTGTIKNHLLNIFKKTNTHSKFEVLMLYNNFNTITR